MNYYEHHLGDYAKKAKHLTMLEHGAYRLLIDICYDTEKPLPADVATIQRRAGARSDEERAAVEIVLREFFTLEEDGWHNSRCDEEIVAARARINTSQKNGKRGGRPRKNQTETEYEPRNNPLETQPVNLDNPAITQVEALQTPDSRLQTPEKKDRSADAPPMAFVGKIIRLSFDDFERWKSAYHALPDIRAELEAADAHYADKPPKDGKWFFPVSNWLKRSHEQALAKEREDRTNARSWN